MGQCSTRLLVSQNGQGLINRSGFYLTLPLKNGVWEAGGCPTDWQHPVVPSPNRRIVENRHLQMRLRRHPFPGEGEGSVEGLLFIRHTGDIFSV
jgi:hypothetical protein